MGLTERFFGKSDPGDDSPTDPAAQPGEEAGLSLQVLMAGDLPGAEALQELVRDYHFSMADATVEFMPESVAQGTPFGLISWDEHVIRFVGFNVPMPEEVVEHCVQPAHYAQDIKETARQHKSHVILWYAGQAIDPHHQYIALASVAAAMAPLGAIVICNETAATSFPAAVLARDDEGTDMVEQLANFPLLFLFCGFVKFDIEGVEGVWMRTYGCEKYDLPNLAMLTEGHEKGEETFELFSNILNYLRDSGAQFAPGHTMQVGEDLYLRLRQPLPQEEWLHGPGEVFVLEFIGADEVNPA